jgi:hypothetical protein
MKPSHLALSKAAALCLLASLVLAPAAGAAATGGTAGK